MGANVLCLFASITVLCFFIFCTVDAIVCPRPALPKNSRLNYIAAFYEVNTTFHYACRRRHYLFGNKYRTCLPNGRWSGTMPYCAGESDKVTLKEVLPGFALLVDGVRSSCLLTSHKSLSKNNSIFLQVRGIQLLIAVEVVPDSPFILGYKVSYYNHSSGKHNYKDSSSYVECLKEDSWSIYICDFHKPTENPIIRIVVDEALRTCVFCEICEVIVFTDKTEDLHCLPPSTEHAVWTISKSAYPLGTMILLGCNAGYELTSNFQSIKCENTGQQPALICMVNISRHCYPSVTEHPYWNKSYNGMTLQEECESYYEFSRNTTSLICREDGKWSPLNCTEISLPTKRYNPVLIVALPAALFVAFTVAAVVAVLLKKRKNKKLESERQMDHQVALGDHYEQVNEPRYRNCSSEFECTYYNDKEMELEKQAYIPMEDDDQYDQVKENRYIIPAKVANLNPDELQPVYINEVIPFSNSTCLLSDEAGYLVPIVSRKASLEDGKTENAVWEEDDTNIYCSIPEETPTQSLNNGENLYANM